LHVQIFISCVSDEFGNYRDALRKDLTRHNLETKIQEDFIASGGATAEKLDDYIKNCHAVIHMVGDMTGAMANKLSIRYINKTYPDFGDRYPEIKPVLEGKAGMSYTQWEAYLAAYHDKKLFVVAPLEKTERNNRYKEDGEQITLQQVHLKNLRALGYYDDIKFTTADELVKKLYRSKLGDLLNALSPVKPANLPYKSIADSFKGRDTVMKELNKMFLAASKAAAIAVYGLGGTGKTRLAVEYAWQHIDDYTALLFITAASPELLETNIANLSESLNLDVSGPEIKEDIKYAAVINWLNQYPGWLLIIDNVDTPEAAKRVEEFFPELQHGHVLITTRIDKWSIQVKKKSLGVLDKEDAAAFLLETTINEREHTNNDRELAHAIADDVGCLALALEQARAYIVTKELSFEKYRKKWEKSRTDVLSWFDEQLMQYPASVAITWQTSFNQLSAAATTLLNRLAWLAPDPIPKTLLDVKWEDPENIDAQAAWEELKQYSLANSAEDKKAFTIHKLVQDVARNKMDKVSQSETITKALHWLQTGFAGDVTNVFDWPHLEPLIPHVLLLAAHAQIKEIMAPTNRLMGKVSIIFYLKAQYSLAEPLMRRILEIDEQIFGPDHPNVATDLNNLAQLLQETNRFQETEPLMRRALEIDKQNFGYNSPHVSRDLNNLAQLLQEINRLQEAEPLMRRALEIDEQHFGSNHSNVAIRLNNLALLLKDTNRLKEAEPLMRRALEIDEKSFGADHPKIATRLSNFALLLKDTNRPAEAEPLLRRALEIDEKSFGFSHPAVAKDLSNLALLLKDTNRLVEAEPLMRRALEINEESFGSNHTNVARDLNNLAQLLKATNRFLEAEPLMIKALTIDEQSFGSNHPRVAIRLNNLALLLQATNRLQEAEPLQKRSLIISCKSLGVDHPNTKTILTNYQIVLEEIGLSEEEIEKTISQLCSDE
jgi:tetratricopeptide (TPR) repeat protein